jgi:hypothetical protein
MPYDRLYWIALAVGVAGLICWALMSRYLRPDVRGPVTAGMLFFRPRLMTRRGRVLLAAGWLCVLFFSVTWWGRMWFR